ncbi:unnamed protein product [Calypogeia fissa]
MGEIGGRRSILFALAVALFVLQFSSLIQAIHITTYTKEDCTGSAVSHMDAVAGECYHARGSKSCGRVTEATTNQQTSFFVTEECEGEKVGTVKGHSPGHNGHSPSHRRRLLGEQFGSKNPCDHGKIMEPNAVGFTEDGKNGTWVLRTTNAAEMLAQMENMLTDAMKVEWLKSLGAIYKMHGESLSAL